MITKTTAVLKDTSNSPCDCDVNYSIINPQNVIRVSIFQQSSTQEEEEGSLLSPTCCCCPAQRATICLPAGASATAAPTYLIMEEPDEDDTSSPSSSSTSAKSITIEPDDIGKTDLGSYSQSDTIMKRNRVKCWDRYCGLVLALASALFYSILLVTVKSIQDVHPITQSIWRYSVYSMLNICVAIAYMYQKRPRSGKIRDNEIFKGVLTASENGNTHVNSWLTIGKVIVGGAIGCSSTLLESLSLNYLTVADSVVVTHISLVFVIILAHFILHEKCSIVAMLMAFCIIIGVSVIARPPFLTGAVGFDTVLAAGLGIKVFDGLFAAIYAIAVRSFRHLHFVLLTFIIGIVGLILATISSFTLGVLSMPSDWNLVGKLVGLGILHFLANICLIQAFQHEKAGPVTLLRSASIPFVILWQVTLLNQMPDQWTILGTMLVSFGVAVTSVRKWIEELPADCHLKKQLWFCLK